VLYWRIGRVLTAFLLVFPASSLLAREVTILYTNDIESVYEPVEASWRDDMRRMGGMARLATLLEQERSQNAATFTVDAGDIFTGSLSKATQGALVFDLYSAMGYDAVNLGNHEFEYGWPVLRQVMQRARFAVLNANIYYTDTDINIARQYAILERDGVRVGVIGLMGIDAFVNTMMAANRDGLSVRPPAEIVQPLIDRLQPEVDLIVLLTHQNRTAPMQTNKEADPEVQRGYDEDYALAGQVRGVDLIVGGHSDNGLTEPVQHPESGTWIVMTFGQGLHLGRISFELGGDDGPRMTTGELIPVNADVLDEDRHITDLISQARAAHSRLTEVVGRLSGQVLRRYYRESTLGNLMADMLKDFSGADVGLMPAGAIRADIQAGDVTVEEILNVFPFIDRVSVVSLPGSALRQVFEKGLSLEYGLSQFAGVELTYDGSRPAGDRLLSASVAGEPLNEARTYKLVTGSFTAKGGENYTMFKGWPLAVSDTLVSDALIAEFRRRGTVDVPPLGRQVDVSRTGD
jgi:2',3'-cyclic-nucleotide 2'-phosphodiesterase (5'-nucleotidase family)